LIRQNYESPLSFIKNQISNTQLADNKLPNSEISPLDFLAYQKIINIHDKTLNFEQDSVDEGTKGPSLFPHGETDFESKAGFFDGGRFFFQQYIELEELDPFVDLGAFQDENFSVEQNIEVNELYNEKFVNRPSELKGKLNPRQFSNLVKLLIPPGENSQMGFGYDNQYKSRKLKDFFKSIKIGLRMCFGLNHYVYMDRLGNEAPIQIDEKIKSASDNLIAIYEQNLKNIAGAEAIAEAFFDASEEDLEASYETIKAFTNFIQRDKSFIIFENVGTGPGTYQTDDPENPYFTKEYSTEELSEAFFESNIAYDPEIGYKEDETKYGTFGFDLAKLIDETKADISFILPIISKDQDIRNNSSFNKFLGKKLSDISEYEGSYEDYMEQLQKFFNRPSAALIVQQLLNDIAFSKEYRILFSYVFAIPEIVNMYLIFFNLIVDTDSQVTGAFQNTKNVMASSIESIYNIKGKNAYKVQPPMIEKSGGPKGIAQGASFGFNKSK
jgi:hypothetical protein